MYLEDDDVRLRVRTVLAERKHRDAPELGHVGEQAAREKWASRGGVGVVHEVLDRATANRRVRIQHRFVLGISVKWVGADAEGESLALSVELDDVRERRSD